MLDKHTNLPAGTVLVGIGLRQGRRIKLKGDMQGDMAWCGYVRRDGEFDLRHRGWSGSLRIADWAVEHEAPTSAGKVA